MGWVHDISLLSSLCEELKFWNRQSMKFHLTTVEDKLYYPLCVCDSAPQTFHKLFFTSFQFPHAHHPLQPLIKSDYKSKWPSPHSVPKRQTYFSQAGLLLLDDELLHLRAPASEPFYLVLYSIYGIWNMFMYIYEKQSLLILKSLFLWMKKLSDPDAFSSSEWSTRLISPRHIWHPCLSVMEGKHAICLTLFSIILICINQNFKKNERKFRGSICNQPFLCAKLL